MSITISNLVKFGIQLLILIVFYIYYVSIGANIAPNAYFLLSPFLLLMMAFLGLGLGMIISSMTTKYRDLQVLVTFAVGLLMYLSAVPYPLREAYKKFPSYVADFVAVNPVTQIIESFRFMVLGMGEFSWTGFIYTFIASMVIFLLGLVVFNQTEKSFIDTV